MYRNILPVEVYPNFSIHHQTTNELLGHRISVAIHSYEMYHEQRLDPTPTLREAEEREREGEKQKMLRYVLHCINGYVII